MGLADWDQAQFTDLRARLGRLVPGTRITVPVWLDLSPDRHELTFDGGPPDAKIRVRHTHADRMMLTQFVQLWKQKPESVLRFARRWGVLYLDENGRPCQTVGPGKRRESLDTWRYYSRRAQAVLNIAANLKLGRFGELDDWAALRGTASRTGGLLEEIDRYSPFMLTMLPRIEYPFSKDGRSVYPKYKRSVKSEIAFLAVEATLWLRLGRVGFVVGFGEHGWGLAIDYNTCMLAAIALQLALVLSDVEAVYHCSGCNLPYARTKRAPKPGQANFCDDCGRKRAVAAADRRRRQKKAKARRLARQGLPVSEIAERLGSTPATIRNWTNLNGSIA
ncbi:MAG TPA: hypothetical protein VIY49_31800 [Bryobacteraceae bacterium]